MKFEEFWIDLQCVLNEKRNFQTSYHKAEFEARYFIGDIQITPSGKNMRTIPKKEFLKIWNIASRLPNEDRFVTTRYRDDTRNISYILAFFSLILRNKTKKMSKSLTEVKTD